jgi:hypothetical protein
MSDAGSEHGSEGQALVESEDRGTEMTYDRGGVPLYVAVAWVTFLVVYVIYMVIYGLPDFSAWGTH